MFSPSGGLRRAESNSEQRTEHTETYSQQGQMQLFCLPVLLCHHPQHLVTEHLALICHHSNCYITPLFSLLVGSHISGSYGKEKGFRKRFLFKVVSIESLLN